MHQIDMLEFLIRKGPGPTELELAKAIHGAEGYQQQVNQDCALLINRGKVERRGSEPFTYFPI